MQHKAFISEPQQPACLDSMYFFDGVNSVLGLAKSVLGEVLRLCVHNSELARLANTLNLQLNLLSPTKIQTKCNLRD